MEKGFNRRWHFPCPPPLWRASWVVRTSVPVGARCRRRRLRYPRGVMGRPRDERRVRPEPAVGDEQMEKRMPVRALARRRTDGCRGGVGGDAGNLTEQAATIQAIGAQPLRNGEHHVPVRHGREERGVRPLRPTAFRWPGAWAGQLGSSHTCTRTPADTLAHALHRIRAKPCSRTPHARNWSATCATTGRHGPSSRAKHLS